MPPKSKKKFSLIQVRALMLQEFQAGRTYQQAARNICRQTEESATTPNTVKKWFEKFAAGDTNLGNKNWKNVEVPNPNNHFLAVNKSLWFEVIDPRLVYNFSTLDGRVGFSFVRDYRKPITIHMVDLLYGKVIDFSVKVDPKHLKVFRRCDVMMLDVDKLLAYDYVYNSLTKSWKTDCFLLNVDFDNLECTVADQLAANGFFYPKLVDQRSHSFGIYPSNNTQTIPKMVSYKDGRLQLGEDIAPDLQLRYSERVGQTVRGLRLHPDDGKRAMNVAQYCESNMVSGELIKSMDIQMKTSDAVPINIQLISRNAYTWNSDRLFVVNSSPSGNSIFSLDIASQIWTKSNINVGYYVSFLHADDDDCLMIATKEPAKNRLNFKTDKTVVHHFSLKKPDSLRNLAFAILRFRSNFFKSDLYGKIVGRLPYNCDLRELFVKETEEEDEEPMEESE